MEDEEDLFEEPFCGLGVRARKTNNGHIISHISPDSDLLTRLDDKGNPKIKEGDIITAISEHGYRIPMNEYSTTRGPAYSLISVHFISTDTDKPSVRSLEQSLYFISRKYFDGSYDMEAIPHKTCESAFVEVDPGELMNIAPSNTQFTSLPDISCYKG